MLGLEVVESKSFATESFPKGEENVVEPFSWLLTSTGA